VYKDSLQDYCGYERFNARCPGDHVINVRRALYGRMQPGRCITGDYGHVMGCYADVTAYVSDTCDYRQNCTLLVATMDSVAQPCAKDFKSYLPVELVLLLLLLLLLLLSLLLLLLQLQPETSVNEDFKSYLQAYYVCIRGKCRADRLHPSVAETGH